MIYKHKHTVFAITTALITDIIGFSDVDDIADDLIGLGDTGESNIHSSYWAVLTAQRYGVRAPGVSPYDGSGWGINY